MIQSIINAAEFKLKQQGFQLMIIAVLWLIPGISFAQKQKEPERCGMDQWLQKNLSDPAFAEKYRQTEAYLKTKGRDRNPSCSNPVIIPVAIHFNGNIIDVPCIQDMADNQIQVLNEDFGAYNSDISNYCDIALDCTDDYPLNSISGGTCIQFCLATMNHPAGSGLSNGDPAFTFGQYTFDTYAPPWDGYLNIFVSDIPPGGYGGNVLGIAPLAGGANPNGNGIWLNSITFGGYEEECISGSVVINNAGNYDLGRTGTHEVGHYFGLYHVFDGCGTGDGIDDTPSQSSPNTGIPVVNADCSSTAGNTCSTEDFFFNYMDYVYDEAMYMFTSDQSDVMYDVATDGAFNTAATTCGTLPDTYDPTYPNGCYTCPVLTVDATTLQVSCFDACDGSISIDDVIEGVGPFVYNWSTGETTATIEDLCPGDYSVTIYDDFNCEVIDFFTITEPDELLANASGTDESGNDQENGTATADPSGGTSPYFYSWSNGEDTQTIEGLAPGNYIVTVTDVNGCISIESVFIEEFICPVLSLQTFQNNVECAGECTGEIEILNVVNGAAPFTYSWSNGATTALINELCAGEYTVTILDAVFCEVISETYIITEPAAMELSLTATAESGFGLSDGTAFANVSGGTPDYGFAWSTGENTQFIENLAPGDYSVTVTDEFDCEQTGTVTVEAFDCPALFLFPTHQNVSCQGDCNGMIDASDISGGTEPYTYAWSNGSSASVISDLCAGSYELSITDQENCLIIQSFEISEPEALNAVLTVTDESAFNANDGSATALPAGGTEPYTFNWSNGLSSQTITDLSPGDYTLTLTDENDCLIILDFTIEAFICPELTILSEINNINCFGSCDGSIEITGLTNGTTPFSFGWNNGNDTATASDLCAGNYTVSITDVYNCTVSSTYTINEAPLLLANAIAVGESAADANDGTASAEPAGGTPPYLFLWSNGETTATISDLAPGSYDVTVTDQNSCTSAETVQVQEYICQGLVIQSQITDNPCFGDCLGSIEVADVENGTGPFDFLWSNGAVTNGISGLCAGSYDLTVTDANNCVIAASYIVQEPAEIVILSEQVTPVTFNQQGSISIETNGDYEYEWTGENGFKSTDKDLVDLDPGCYALIITDPATNCTLDTIICVEDLTATTTLWTTEINLYPNPVLDELTVDYSSIGSNEVEITLLDLNGKNIAYKQNEHVGQKMKIQTKELKSGIYMIRISWEGNQIFRKIVLTGL